MAKKKVKAVPKVPLSKAETKKYKDQGVICLIRWYYETGFHKTDFGRPVNSGDWFSSGEEDYWELGYKVLPHWAYEDPDDPRNAVPVKMKVVKKAK